MARRYLALLEGYLPYIRSNLRDWPRLSGSKYHKRDGSQEHAVRQNATVAYGLAVLGRYGRRADSEEIIRDCASLVRYLSATHRANQLATGDGKQWGDQWQSAHWAAYAGKAAWLIWDRLDDNTRQMAARMVIHEADRFNERPPDDGEWKDTKAEENAWNSQAPALATCMFPHHPRAALWDERARLYMMNSFSVRADHRDTTEVDGRPVKDWVTTVCLHDDFTLENHARVHPDYMGAGTLQLRNGLVYLSAARDIPRSCFHHIPDVLQVFKLLVSPQGSSFYVNGQDWWPHRHDVPLAFGGFAGAFLHDADAARMEQDALESLEKLHSRFPDGRAFHPREYNYPNVEEELIARYSELYLTHCFCGDTPPTPRAEFDRRLRGARIFEAGGFVIDRSAERFASFAWVNGAMGLVYPRGDTYFTSPDTSSLLGKITIRNATDSVPQVTTRTARVLDPEQGGFAVAGRFLRCEGKVAQDAAMVSLPSGPVLYIERLTALEDVTLEEAATGTFVILNEDAPPLACNRRILTTAEGTRQVSGLADIPDETFVIAATFADVDGKLVVRTAPAGQMRYLARHAYRSSRLDQELASFYTPGPVSIPAGRTFSERALAAFTSCEGPEAPQPVLRRFGSPLVAVEAAGRLVAVNFGHSTVTLSLFGEQKTLEPFGVAVWMVPQAL
ncbi:MAG: hypothetical protein KatS3mg024_0823 [Armatimonadota bacterium]|nr:MAG: hypothetical protein KatS3mg024_0823 [Armatimonadota bacterium]